MQRTVCAKDLASLKNATRHILQDLDWREPRSPSSGKNSLAATSTGPGTS